MKFTNLFAILLAALFIIGCGAKEEEVVDGGTNNEIIEENIDDANLTNVIEDNTWEEDLNPADSSSKETMTYDENVQEELVDPPVKEETKPVVEEKKETVHQKRFYIVVGSFKEYGNAQKINDKFKNEGYYPMILPKVNEYNRVAIASYVEEANARKAIKKLRTKYNDLTFWLYKW